MTRLDRNDCRFASLQANLLREGGHVTARAREGWRGGFLWGRVARYQEPAIKSNNGIHMMEWQINEYGRGRHGPRYLFPKSSFGLPMITQQNDPKCEDYEAHGACAQKSSNGKA